MCKKLKLFSTYFQCPSCWLDFKDTYTRYLPQYFEETLERLCPYCEKRPSSLEVLKRQIEFLHQMQTANIPYFLQELTKHIDLKE